MSPAGNNPQERYSLLGSRAMRWAVGVGAAIVVSIALVLLFLLTDATDNRALYERNYVRLFGVNVVVAVLLLAVIGWIGLRLFVRLKRGRFGSRLLMKLAIIFAVLGFLPGMLIYTVSYQFVTRSIESWFDVKVEGALDAGLSLGRSTLEALASDLASKTRNAGTQVATLSDAGAARLHGTVVQLHDAFHQRQTQPMAAAVVRNGRKYRARIKPCAIFTRSR